jgi:hypothetical protein
MIKAMPDEVLKRLQQERRECLLIILLDFEDFLGRDQGLLSLRIAYLGEHDAMSESEAETDAE